MDSHVFLAVLAAALLHAGWNAVLKVGLDRLSSIALLSVVQSAMALTLLPFFAAPAPASWPWIAASAVLHSGYKLFLVRAYEHADLSVAYPLARGTAPLIVAVVGMLALGETAPPARVAAVVLIAAGVIVMSLKAGGIGRISGKAVIYALATATFTASYTLVDGIGARSADSVTGFTMWLFVGDGLIMVLYGLGTRGAAIFSGMRHEWRGGIAAGAMSLGSYWIAIWAFTCAPLALVAALRETSVLFAMLIGVFALGERVGAWRWFAAVLMVCGVVTMRT